MTAHAALTARERLERDFEALRIAALDAADAALDQAPTDAGAAFDASFDPLAKRFLDRAPLADKARWRNRIVALRDRRHDRLNAAQAAARGARRRARLAETDALALQAVAREADPRATDAIIAARRAAYAAAAAAGALRRDTAAGAGDAFAAAARREMALALAMAGAPPSLDGLAKDDRDAVKAALARAIARRDRRAAAEAQADDIAARRRILDALAHDAPAPDAALRAEAERLGLGAALKAAGAVRAEALGHAPERLEAAISRAVGAAPRRAVAARAARSRLRGDAVAAAADAGVIDPVGAPAFSGPELLGGLTGRARAADIARAWAGAPSAPMLGVRDRDALRAAWVAATDGRAALLDAFAAAPRLESARVALVLADAAPALAAAIALGAGGAETLRALAAVPKDLDDDPPDLGPLSTGWRVLLAGRAAADRAAGLSDGGAKAARHALLGPDLTIRGVALPAPAPGVRDDDLDAGLRAFGAGALVRAGVDPKSAAVAAKTGAPVFVSPGVILMCDADGAALADRHGHPAAIDLVALLRGAAA